MYAIRSYYGIIKGYSEIQKQWDGVNYYLYPEVNNFNGVLDGNGHTIKNLQLSVNNNGTPIPASNNIGMIHTLSETRNNFV